MAVTIRRLQDSDVVESFDCRDEALNNYLQKHAWTNQQKISIGVTYVAVDDAAPHAVIGYFTLATSRVPRDAFPQKHVRGLPPYDLPLILLARLAVDHRFHGKGLGHLLLSEALKISVNVSEQVGCRSVITEAYTEESSGTPAMVLCHLKAGPISAREKCSWIRTIKAAAES